jgi:2,4-dienoyl-CoA reductase-like NADH-dependent reductase (Old Yellow Enzyme family)
MAQPRNLNPPVPGLPYFTPQHLNSPGTPKNLTASTPTLFTPLQVRDVTLRNRILIAPMCQYSAAHEGPEIGALTDWHVATLGHYAIKGAALVFIEATGVQACGRISPNCPGIWADAQIPGVKRVADFVKSQGALCGIQLAHAGRKASTAAAWVNGRVEGKLKRSDVDVGGWPEDVVGPSGGEEHPWDGPWNEGTSKFWRPRALSREEIRELVKDWARAAERSVKAGIDVIEIHAAHGYLLHQFMSPVTNRRTDEYGGSFENRIRLLVEIVEAIRRVIPTGMPLFLRISSTEWLEGTDVEKQMGGSWDVEDSIRLAKMLPAMGVDLLDVSTGGNHPAQRVDMFNSKDYQVKIAGRIRDAVSGGPDGKKLLIGAVGRITEAEQARDLIQEEAEDARDLTDAKDGKQPKADVILVARQFMREPEWVLRVAAELGVEVWWASQFMRTSFPLRKMETSKI